MKKRPEGRGQGERTEKDIRAATPQGGTGSVGNPAAQRVTQGVEEPDGHEDRPGGRRRETHDVRVKLWHIDIDGNAHHRQGERRQRVADAHGEADLLGYVGSSGKGAVHAKNSFARLRILTQLCFQYGLRSGTAHRPDGGDGGS